MLLQVKFSYSYHFFNKSEILLVNFSVGLNIHRPWGSGKILFYVVILLTDDAKICKKPPTILLIWDSGEPSSDAGFDTGTFVRQAILHLSKMGLFCLPAAHDKFTPALRTCPHPYLERYPRTFVSSPSHLSIPPLLEAAGLSVQLIWTFTACLEGDRSGN